MAKSGKLKRLERKQAEPDIQVDVPKADKTGAATQPFKTAPPASAPKKKGAGGRQRGSLSSAKAHAKREKALERDAKLELKKMSKAVREEKVKAAKS